MSGRAYFFSAGILLAGSLLAPACRRAPAVAAAPASAAQAAPVETDDPPARERRAPSDSHPVIWIALDGLDWEIMDRLAAEGRMPHWKQLVAEGWSGKIRSFMPILSPIVWTTAFRAERLDRPGLSSIQFPEFGSILVSADDPERPV